MQSDTSGKLDGLLMSGARFSEKLAILSAHSSGKSEPVSCKRIGADKVFGRLWRDLGLETAIKKSVRGRKFQFDIERAIYHTVLHRLFTSGSDRSSLVWRQIYSFGGTEELELQHLYRAMGFLGEAQKDQTGRTAFVPRCITKTK